MAFHSKEYLAVIKEHFDLKDNDTRKSLLSFNETEQAQTLSKLTSELYDHIVKKVDDIDFGGINESKGDITQIPNYDKLLNSVQVMRKLLVEFKQKTEPVDAVEMAINNILERKDQFTLAYKLNIEFPMVLYATMTLNVISSISLMIATCVEYVKTPGGDAFEISLDKVALAKTKEALQFDSLRKFNNICRTGEMDRCLNAFNKVNANNLVGIDVFTIMNVIVITSIALSIIPMMREVIYFFYHTRVRVSDYFDIQADLLQMNVYNLERNTEVDPNKKESIIRKQTKIVEIFRKLADKISISSKKAETESRKEIANDKKEFKTDSTGDVVAKTSGSLF